MHGLPFACASKMRESCTGDVDAMRFAGPVDGGSSFHSDFCSHTAS